MRFPLAAPAAAVLAALALAGCVTVTASPGPGPAPAPGPRPNAPVVQQPAVDRVSSATAVQNFQAAASRVEPAAEALCRQRAPQLNCDFLIRVDPDPRLPPNAFQTLDRGRPVVIFTRSLIAEARNIDEIAFVIGHESAHHIENHLSRQRQSAATGAIIGTVIGQIAGANAQTVNELGRAGAFAGARRFSKTHELEADALGTIIVARAGFDPVRGSVFFGRIPDPGDQFLGTHPPNADRIATVRRVAAGL